MLAGTGLSQAGEIGDGRVKLGEGIGYQATLVVEKIGGTIPALPAVKSDDMQTNPNDATAASSIPRAKSMGWNDPAVNPWGACTAGAPTAEKPLADPNTVNCVPANGYGWGHNSHWYLVDLNQLYTQGVRWASVSVMVKRYDDGVAVETTTDANGNTTTNPGDDDLIPAATVWKGNQNYGQHLHWYPNKYQNLDPSLPDSDTWWATALKPAYKIDGTYAFGSAYGTADPGMVKVDVVVNLKPGYNNYLTVALAGDGQHVQAGGDKIGQIDSRQKHDVNYQIVVSASKISPPSNAQSIPY